jgi:hypothetical protein
VRWTIFGSRLDRPVDIPPNDDGTRISLLN